MNVSLPTCLSRLLKGYLLKLFIHASARFILMLVLYQKVQIGIQHHALGQASSHQLEIAEAPFDIIIYLRIGDK